MDREQLFNNAKQWYPVAAAILSSLLNFLSFMIGIHWDPNAFFQISLFALLGTIIVSSGVIFALYRIGISGYPDDFTVLRSSDIYKIVKPQEVIYKRIVTIRVNKPVTHYVFYPPLVDGELREFKAYNIENPDVTYNVSIQKVGGRKVLFIFLDRPLGKGDVVNGLCIECLIINSFESEYEGVSVETVPNQAECKVRVSLPQDCPPTRLKAEWFVFYKRNQEYIDNGDISIEKLSDGTYVISHDFSSVISKKNVGLQCAISWRWDISNCVS